jgi:hypothetical protein
MYFALFQQRRNFSLEIMRGCGKRVEIDTITALSAGNKGRVREKKGRERPSSLEPRQD